MKIKVKVMSFFLVFIKVLVYVFDRNELFEYFDNL